MFNVCPNCGMYSVEKHIDPSRPFAICPHCRYAHPFIQQPLFILTGASGAGKSTACLYLTFLLKECVVLDQDILWGVVPDTSEDSYSSYRNVWLRVAKNVGQAGKAVVLGGTALPEQFEECPERLYFSTLYYLAFVCDDDVLVERLKQRPEWRMSHTPENLEKMVQFNRWLKANASLTKPPMTLYDTSHRSVDETVKYTAEWVRKLL
jgi:hypothetical protein